MSPTSTPRCRRLATACAMHVVLGVPGILAQDRIPPDKVNSVALEIPIPTRDFSDLEHPTRTPEDALAEALVAGGAIPAEQFRRDPEGKLRLAAAIEAQARAEISQALLHDGYAGRVWVHDPTEGTLVKIVLVLYPSENPEFTQATRAHEYGHAATHRRVVERAKENARVSRSPGKPERVWKSEILKAEDAGAAVFHGQVGMPIPESLDHLLSAAEDYAVLEAEGNRAADQVLPALQPFSPPGPRR